MPTAQPRILVIANRTASTPMMLETVAERGRAGATFTLLIPPEHGHDEDWSQEVGLERVGNAAGGDVASLDAGEDPCDTVHRAVSDGEFDELIVCTAPEHLARWVHHDLPSRLQHLGLPVMVIPADPDVPLSPSRGRRDAGRHDRRADTGRRGPVLAPVRVFRRPRRGRPAAADPGDPGGQHYYWQVWRICTG